ncbi:TadE/TadG family type IV pilus assembly protein [Devosia faecipullorum]|uniref:TadE/TadG family type IV pilus assembly protein n=1 Tax=Devosia faecipullorum TaxID=2755039 RepID=UPI00187B7339|nr:TadE/TadG family type IV pilus assembly protein [Devosia faecipullorum]MBE7733417.1 pilus assembly protein [Devosia faecipullorum]
MVPRPRDWAGDTRGAALIEFAILTPVFLLMVMGMLAYGIYFGAAHALQQLAADAARTAIAGISASEGRGLVESYLARNAGAYMLIDPQRLSFRVEVAASNPDQYLVELRYDASDLPIWNLYPPLPLPEKQIARGATIRRGGI